MPDSPKIASYPSVLAVVDPGPSAPRFFSNDAIQAAVDKALTRLPPEGHSASLSVQGDDGHVAVVIAARLGEKWTVQGAWDKAIGDRKGEGSSWMAAVTWRG